MFYCSCRYTTERRYCVPQNLDYRIASSLESKIFLLKTLIIIHSLMSSYGCLEYDAKLTQYYHNNIH